MTNGAHVSNRAETDMLSLQFPWLVLPALLSRGEVGRGRCWKRGEPEGGERGMEEGRRLMFSKYVYSAGSVQNVAHQAVAEHGLNQASDF